MLILFTWDILVLDEKTEVVINGEHICLMNDPLVPFKWYALLVKVLTFETFFELVPIHILVGSTLLVLKDLEIHLPEDKLWFKSCLTAPAIV